MIHKVILENGRYIGKTRLDEVKNMVRAYAFELFLKSKEYYGSNTDGLFIKPEAKKLLKNNNNLYKRILVGYTALHQTGLNNKEQYNAIVNFLKSNKPINTDINKLTSEEINILNILEGG